MLLSVRAFLFLPYLVASHPCSSKINASKYDAHELAAAKHTSDLADAGPGEQPAPVHLYVDHRHSGIGGETSWLPNVEDRFLVNEKQYEYGMWLVPLRRGDTPENVGIFH